MPQSNRARENEIQNHSEHVASAATHTKGDNAHLSKHEETVQAEIHSHDQPETSKLVHGKAAALEAEKHKK